MRMVKYVLVPMTCLLGACAGSGRTGPDDPDRLLHMAGEEAALIQDGRLRLARQLAVAFRQNANGRYGDARTTLARARQTLAAAECGALNDHDRLAGWISVSELCRGASDGDGAGQALDQAVRHLQQMNPPYERCQYVLGVAREAKALRGVPEATLILLDGGGWAVEIPDVARRRQAYMAFVNQLLGFGDYDSALKVLRNDTDATWRSDTLLALADSGRVRHHPQPLAAHRGLQAPPEASSGYGRALDYASTYQQVGR